MSVALIIGIYTLQLAICLVVVYWLFQRYEGSKPLLIITALAVTFVLVALALYIFIVYAASVLILVLMVRWLMAEWEHPKYGGIVLGIYFGFFLSFPVGVYQYAN